jgi:hypothetical protein
MRFWHTGYVCPILMNLTLVALRLCGRRVLWADSGGVWRLIETKAGLSHGWEARCLFPRWMILTECRFWNSRIGILIRARFERHTPRPSPLISD